MEDERQSAITSSPRKKRKEERRSGVWLLFENGLVSASGRILSPSLFLGEDERPPLCGGLPGWRGYARAYASLFAFVFAPFLFASSESRTLPSSYLRLNLRASMTQPRS